MATKKMKKYQDGGKVTRADIRDAQRAAKLKRIEAGTEPSTYEKVANISGNVAKTAVAAGETAKAVRDTRTGMSGPGGMQKGGMVKKYQDGGRTISERAAERKSAKGKGLYVPTDGTKSKGLYVGYNKAGRKEVKETGGTEGYNLKPMRKVMKTGGMVNSNAKVSASKVAGGRPAKSAEPKSASKRATGRVGGTSTAPKTAMPKAKMGGSMRGKKC
jgi:hypothetical protein